MPNAMESVGEHVEEEPAHELSGGETHHLVLAASVLAIVLPAEGNVAVVDRDEPPVADRHAMRVAGEIGEDLLGAGERPLGVADPLRAPERREMVAEPAHVAESSKLVEERPRAMRCRR